MTRTTRTLLAGGTAALLSLSLAGIAAAGGRGGDRDDRGYRTMSTEILEQFDADGDGVVTQIEVDQVRSGRLADFDADGDGNLTLEEYQALWADATHGRMVDRFQHLDADGDAVVTAAEFGAGTGRFVQRHDRNGDGQVAASELRGRGGERWYDDDDGEDDD